MKVKRFHFDINNLIDDTITLTGQDAVHAKDVMRLKIGDEFIAICGNGLDYYVKIVEFIDSNIICKVQKVEQNLADPQVDVTLYQALLKADKLDLVVQKATEIGVQKIVLFQSEFCVAKWQGKSNKLDRLNKISVEATKQCGRSEPLTIVADYFFSDVLNELANYDCVIFAYENAKDYGILDIKGDYKKIAIIVGSEGGFSQSECQVLCKLKNVHCITLGHRILRAETASIVASALVMAKFEK